MTRETFEQWLKQIDTAAWQAYRRLAKDAHQVGVSAGTLLTWWADGVSAHEAAKRMFDVKA